MSNTDQNVHAGAERATSPRRTPNSEHDAARELLDRVRAALAPDHLREVRMFGVTAVMIDGAMAVAAHRDGSLLVRVDPAEEGALLENPDASRAVMGNGRSMGAGWIRVDATAVATDDDLGHWLDAATRRNSRHAQ